MNDLTISQKFEQFDKENPHVFEEIVSISTTAKQNGVERLGIATIFEVMRYNLAIRTKGDRFKLNNNYRALYVRKLISLRPEFESMFQLRERTAIEVID